ncbi:MAG TPA: M13 family metallopeptidase [Tahibacter sp.]|uniref:M13 family metallopeptidase n=1 Tax=Tahibacter sp. TaxID=2056211 RepID=UPI002CABB507|nr:M13 family metallopeptidase [Tahibacter sp.]HSX60126.1 M13 family metallopeptidase [Tahibacter sp.]
MNLRSALPRLSALALAFAATLAAAHTNQRGLDPRNFDTKTAACADFFQYANGGWLAGNPIPQEYSQWSLDNEIQDRNEAVLHDVLKAAAEKPGAAGSVTQKIGDFFASAMDEAAVEKAGAKPLAADLARIAALKTNADIVPLLRDWHAAGTQVLFDFGPEADMKNASQVIGYATQGGLGLPDRDYYFRDDAKSKALLQQYRDYVAALLKLTGDSAAAANAAHVVALETRLAKDSLDPLALRDPNNFYHIHTLAQADAKTPHFSWGAYFAALGRGDVTSFSLAQPEFFAAMDKALTDVPLAHWQAYLRFHLADDAAAYLSSDFVNAQFAFRSKTLRGVEVLKPRWRRAIDATNAALGEAVGEIYVARVFPPAAKAGAEQLVGNLKKALRARIAKLDWMDAPTKQAAYAKLDTLVSKIGYPDRWRDYSGLTIARGDYFANIEAASRFEAKRLYAKIGKPVDRGEWEMTPQTVNAYYNPLQNEIVFPAAQLLPPYFDEKMDDAVNYGGIGSVIGHELLHGFDDQGSQFDAKGNLANWWSDKDKAQFEARTDKLVKQFDAFVVVDDLHIQGRLTLGENIADLGGLQVAWDAFRIAQAGKPGKPVDGMTPEQRFFLAFAQAWRTAQRPAALRLQVQSNVHSPAKWRVLGPVANLPEFAAAFSCRAGDAMVRDASQRVVIW